MQISEGIQRRRIGISRRRHGAAQRARDDVRRQVVAPGTFPAERRDLHNHEFGPAREGGVETFGFRAERARATEHDLRAVDQRIELRIARVAIEIHAKEAPRRRKECMPKRLRPLRRVFQVRPAAPQRVSLRRFRPHDIGTEISKQFPTIDAALVGQIDDPHILQGAGGLRHWWSDSN